MTCERVVLIYAVLPVEANVLTIHDYARVFQTDQANYLPVCDFACDFSNSNYIETLTHLNDT